jgi:hypothetical protein
MCNTLRVVIELSESNKAAFTKYVSIGQGGSLLSLVYIGIYWIYL